MDCGNCGSPLLKKAEFCTNCGAPVKDPRLQQGGIASGAASMDKRIGNIVIGVLGVIAFIAIVVAVVSLHGMGVTSSEATSAIGAPSYAGDRASEQEPSPYNASSRSSLLSDDEPEEIADAPVVMMPGAGGAASDSSAPPDEGDGSNEGDSDGGEAPSEADEVHDILKAYYDDAGIYNNYVEQCAEDFNNHFLDKSKATREELAESAEYLKADIDELRSYLLYLDLPSSSEYYEVWKDICTLYECLWHRVDVLTKSWDISLSYDNPKEHEEEILEPIKADNVDGDNKYYTQFRELYPTIKL